MEENHDKQKGLLCIGIMFLLKNCPVILPGIWF